MATQRVTVRDLTSNETHSLWGHEPAISVSALGYEHARRLQQTGALSPEEVAEGDYSAQPIGLQLQRDGEEYAVYDESTGSWWRSAVVVQ